MHIRFAITGSNRNTGISNSVETGKMYVKIGITHCSQETLCHTTNTQNNTAKTKQMKNTTLI